MFHTWSQTLRNQHLSGYRFSSNPQIFPILDAKNTPQSQLLTDTQLCWLHGNGFNSLAYKPLFEALLEAMPYQSSLQNNCALSIFATDLPGHGRSSPAPESWPDWRGMAAAVEQAMQQQFTGADSPPRQRVGVGHSLGGMLMLLQAHQNPQRFDKILLLDPVLFTPAMVMGQQTIKSLGLWQRMPLPKQALKRRNRWSSTTAMQQQLASKGFYRRWHPQALAGFVEGGHRRLGADSEAVADRAVALSCEPEWEARIFASYPKLLNQAVKQIQIPVQIICAEHSMPFVLKGAKRAAALNPNISYRIWGQGHCFPMEQPEQTAELIRQWIAESP